MRGSFSYDLHAVGTTLVTIRETDIIWDCHLGRPESVYLYTQRRGPWRHLDAAEFATLAWVE